uniref:Uncharacterized protein n=1 Tax=Anopheles culicifacies TaxID=139723 RepID=A0A182LVJ9_9DIPT
MVWVHGRWKHWVGHSFSARYRKLGFDFELISRKIETKGPTIGAGACGKGPQLLAETIFEYALARTVSLSEWAIFVATSEDSPAAMKLKKMWLKTPVSEEQAAQAVLDPALG